MIIQRYLSESKLQRIKKDFAFLINYIKDEKSEFRGELDIALRRDRFNIYYKGNSLALIIPVKDDRYSIQISEKFLINPDIDFSEFNIQDKPQRGYHIFSLRGDEVHPFFQKKHLGRICRRIKEVAYSEEIAFEQSILTDNAGRDDLIIIDRQIQDTSWPRKMDLLALEKKEGNKYMFKVLEVKLGNNPELEGKVISQLNDYVNHIHKNFHDYIECYERHFRQKKELGLITSINDAGIEIIKPVKGCVVVGGYKSVALSKINALRQKDRNIKVVCLFHEL